HLLFAAREPGAWVGAPFLQAGEQGIHAIERPSWGAQPGTEFRASVMCRASLSPACGSAPSETTARHACRGQQVFFNAEVREDLPPFGYQADAGSGDLVAGMARRVLPVEMPAARLRAQQAHNAFDGCALAHAVAPEQGHEFAGADMQAHAMEYA